MTTPPAPDPDPAPESIRSYVLSRGGFVLIGAGVGMLVDRDVLDALVRGGALIALVVIIGRLIADRRRPPTRKA